MCLRGIGNYHCFVNCFNSVCYCFRQSLQFQKAILSSIVIYYSKIAAFQKQVNYTVYQFLLEIQHIFYVFLMTFHHFLCSLRAAIFN